MGSSSSSNKNNNNNSYSSKPQPNNNNSSSFKNNTSSAYNAGNTSYSSSQGAMSNSTTARPYQGTPTQPYQGTPTQPYQGTPTNQNYGSNSNNNFGGNPSPYSTAADPYASTATRNKNSTSPPYQPSGAGGGVGGGGAGGNNSVVGFAVPNSKQPQPNGNYTPAQSSQATNNRNTQPPYSTNTPQPYNNQASPSQPIGGRSVNGQTPPNQSERRPINPNDRTDIYGAQPKQLNIQQQYNNNQNDPYSNSSSRTQPVKSQTNPSQSYNNLNSRQQQQPPYTNNSQSTNNLNDRRTNSNNRVNFQQQQQPNSNRQNTNNFTTNFTQGSFSNLNNSQSMNSFRGVHDFGPRIARRELWWKEPERSQARIPFSQPLRIENITPRVDDKNPNYVPARPQYRTIQSRKLEWHAEPITDTWGNIKHQPRGLILMNIISSSQLHLTFKYIYFSNNNNKKAEM